MSDLAIITVAYRSDAVLPRFLRSVGDASSETAFVWIVDNSPGAGQAAPIAQQFGANYLPLERNAGYGAAINAAVSHLPPNVEWILVSNPDIELLPGSIDQLKLALKSDPLIGAVGPQILNEDGTVYPSARRLPDLSTGIGHAMFSRTWPTNPWTKRYLLEEVAPHSSRKAGWLSGACLLVRRSAFDRLDGFDEGYFMYFEDVDLGFRLQRAGYANYYVPDAKVIHTGAHSTISSAQAMSTAHHESSIRYLTKRYGGIAYAPVRGVLRIGLKIRAAWIGRQEARRK